MSSISPRARAIAQVYIGLGILIAVLIMVAGPKLMSEGRRLTSTLPVWMDQLTTGKIALQVGIKQGWSIMELALPFWLLETPKIAIFCYA